LCSVDLVLRYLFSVGWREELCLCGEWLNASTHRIDLCCSPAGCSSFSRWSGGSLHTTQWLEEDSIMLTANIKINGELVARIDAKNVRTLSDEEGDFVGDRATVCEYDCAVAINANPGVEFHEMTVAHDRRFGWQGLLAKILAEVTPTIVETVNTADLDEIRRRS